MKRYSFLEESFNKLVKRLQRYSPDKRKSIVRKMIETGELYPVDEYSQRMISGQRKRLHNIANQNKRKLSIIDVSDLNDASMLPATDIRLLRKPSISWDNTINPIEIKKYRNSIRGIDTVSIPRGNSIDIADSVSHEVDEYSKLFRNSKRLNISPSKISVLSHNHNLTSPGKHEIGVLNQELKRQKKLASVYPVSFHSRNSDEVKHNSVPVKTLLKYTGTIHPKIQKIIDNPIDSKTILDKQKEIIFDLLKRKETISKIPNGFVKDLKLAKLRNDFEHYNSVLDANRKPLKIDF